MAFVAFGDILFPEMPPSNMSAAIVLSQNLLMDAAGEKVGIVFKAPNTVTTPTDTDFRVETVDGTTGSPSGALWAANTNITVLQAAITSNTFVLSGNLTADASVTRGQDVAIVFAPSGSPNLNISAFAQPLPNNSSASIPYLNLFTAAYAKVTGFPVFAVEYSDGSYAVILAAYPASAVVDQSLASNTTPDEIALKLTPTAPVRVVGMWGTIDVNDDFEFVLYAADGTTVLESIAVDVAIVQTNVDRNVTALFATSVELTAGLVCYAAVKPSTTTAIQVATVTTPSAAAMDQMSGGQAYHYAERTDAGAWSPTTTRRPWIGLIIDGISDGAGSGGGPLVGGGKLIGS